MSIIQGNAHTSAGGGGFQIERSLRFNSADSAYLNRTPASAGSYTTWTFSCWIKRNLLGSAQTFMGLRIDGNNFFQVAFNASDQLSIESYNTGIQRVLLVTTQVFRDPSAWYSITLTADSPNATSTDRFRVYINGVRVTNFSSAVYPAQSVAVSNWNGPEVHNIGRYPTAVQYTSAYFAEINFIDGQALTPSSFGETDSNTGVWKPKAFSGTYGTNGFFLKFADNSNTTAATLGKDYSGNGNNWTPNNFSVTAGAGNDSMVDSPTSYGTDTGVGGEVRGNYCTWNSTWANPTLTNGNLDYTTTAGSTSAIGTLGVSSGKWYFEVLTTTSACSIGVAPPELFNKEIGETSTSYGYTYNGTKYTNGSTSAYGNSYTANDIIGVALDLDNGKIWFSKNGTFQASGDPAAGTNAAFTGLSGTFTVGVSRMTPTQQSGSLNAGQRAFAYTAPSGFKALCTQNLPTPTIGATSTTQANDYFTAYLYTADGTSPKSRTGIGFAPDFLWFKSRSTTFSHALYDQVRGTNKGLQTNTTAVENSYTLLSTFGSDGFTTTTDGTVGNLLNDSTNTYVTWAWNAGGSNATNTAGTITSTVRANTTSGFSIISYTGNKTSGATIGHGLGVAPAMVIIKERANASEWIIYHQSLGATQAIYFTTAAANTNSIWFNNTAPSSTVITLGNSDGTNRANTMIAYAFAPVAGYSAAFSYTGNASSDGPYIHLGFTPKFILIKSSSATGDWVLEDRSRSPYNVSTNYLVANSSAAETTGQLIDFLSNGFKIRVAVSSAMNGSGTSYIGFAWAENPFKYSLGI